MLYKMQVGNTSGPFPYVSMLTTAIPDPLDVTIVPENSTALIASHLDQTIWSVQLAPGLPAALPNPMFTMPTADPHPSGIDYMTPNVIALSLYGPPGGSYFGPGNVSLWNVAEGTVSPIVQFVAHPNGPYRVRALSNGLC